MFDLEQHISQWRSQFADGPNYNRADLEELEAHLREEIEKLSTESLSEEECFWLASHRLGAPSQLGPEFAKNRWGLRWRRRLSWALGGYVLIQLFSASRTLLSNLLYSTYGYLPQGGEAGFSSAATFILTPFAALFGDGVIPADNLANLLAIDILWQVGLMAAVAVVLFSPRFRQKSHSATLLQKISQLPPKILWPGVLLAFPLFFLARSASQVIVVNQIGTSSFGSISAVNYSMGFLWGAFLVLLFFGLLLQNHRQKPIIA